MSTSNPSPRRKRYPGDRNHNIYSRRNAAGVEIFEVGFRDSENRQRFRTVGPKLTHARAVRDEILAQRSKGGYVRPNPRLRFGDAADRWLEEQVSDRRQATRDSYRNSIEKHLRPRWGSRRLDRIRVGDAALLVRELRAEGKAEATIESIIKAGRRVFKFARRHLDWYGNSPFEDLESGERPKLSNGKHRIFEGDELAETIAAAREPWKTLFVFAATTGARESECLGLQWADLDLSLDAASVTFTFQVDRQGQRQQPKTEDSVRTIELPRSLAAMLAAHKAGSAHSQERSFVFATSSGRPISQRNALRSLRRAETAARKPNGKPTFPVLNAVDANGEPVPVPRGSVPNFHSLRHTAASEAIRDGESAEEVSWQLGHRNSNVTRAVYLHEIKTMERSARRRAKFEARIARVLRAPSPLPGSQVASRNAAEVIDLDTRVRPGSQAQGK